MAAVHIDRAYIGVGADLAALVSVDFEVAHFGSAIGEYLAGWNYWIFFEDKIGTDVC